MDVEPLLAKMNPCAIRGNRTVRDETATKRRVQPDISAFQNSKGLRAENVAPIQYVDTIVAALTPAEQDAIKRAVTDILIEPRALHVDGQLAKRRHFFGREIDRCFAGTSVYLERTVLANVRVRR
jgi:hypothetical protein